MVKLSKTLFAIAFVVRGIYFREFEFKKQKKKTNIKRRLKTLFVNFTDLPLRYHFCKQTEIETCCGFLRLTFLPELDLHHGVNRT